MIEVNPGRRPTPPGDGFAARRMLVFLLPVIVAGVATAVVAVGAALVGFQRETMLLVAAGIGVLLAIPTLLVIYREIADRRAAVHALANVEARVGRILESAMDAIITLDERQQIVFFNRAAEEVFACPRAEAIGAHLDGFIPERYRAGHRKLVDDFGRSRDTSRRMGHARVVRGLRRNGEEFPMEASISHILEDGQRYYTVILRDVTERMRAEEALRASSEQVHTLALAASNAREQEKARIARELHDELGQGLTALKMDVGWLRANIGSPSREVSEKIASMQGLLDATVASARRISADLRPLMLDDLGLTAAAEWMVQNFSSRTGIACDLELGRGDLDLPDPYATTVFRVLQESLTNAAKHAQATRVDVSLEREGPEIVLAVSDDGRGFEPAAPVRPNAFGLVGLRERALLVGGEISIDSAPGRGTRVELRVPVKEAA